jgi:Uma2 family endonuclease
MSIAVIPAPQEDSRPRRLWTREEYYRAIDLGLFKPGERLELLEGEIYPKMSENPPHATALKLAEIAIARAFALVQGHSSTQHPISLPGDSEPEPYIAMLRGDIRQYATRHPASEDVMLVVEVSDATLAFDRTRKARIYAESGIREYWIINLIDRCLEVHRDPQNGAYQSVVVMAEDATVSPLAAPAASIAIRDMLP